MWEAIRCNQMCGEQQCDVMNNFWPKAVHKCNTLGSPSNPVALCLTQPISKILHVSATHANMLCPRVIRFPICIIEPRNQPSLQPKHQLCTGQPTVTY